MGRTGVLQSTPLIFLAEAHAGVHTVGPGPSVAGGLVLWAFHLCPTRSPALALPWQCSISSLPL